MRHALLVSVAGVSSAMVAALALGLPTRDAAVLVALSFGAAAVSYAVGSRVIPLTRRSLGVASAAMVVALIPIASFAVGALAAARAMFVSTHDLLALVVIVIGSCTAAVLGGIALGRDLADARRDADRAIERERMIEKSRRELVAWVSHDLRTPLAGIRAMVEAIDDGVVADGDTVGRYHRRIAADVETLSRLIDDLFELSRIEVDGLELTLEPVSIGAIVTDAVAAVSTIARVRQVTVDAAAAFGGPSVAASTRELTRVVHNLLDNAIKHTPAGGRVVVDVGADGDHALITVRDECGGIPEIDLDRVFDVAYSGDHARTPGSGSGLGLAIARGFVQAHQGRIDVVNVDDGCCFTVRIPVATPR